MRLRGEPLTYLACAQFGRDADIPHSLQARLTSQDAVLIKAQAEVSRLSNVETDLQTRLADVGKAQKVIQLERAR